MTILDLRFMEPVEIDFVIGGNVDKEGGKVVRSLDDITQAGKRSVTEAKKAVAEQKKVVGQIESDIRSIEKTLQRAVPGKEKFAVEAELRSAKKVLEEEKGALTAYEQKVNDVAGAHKQLRTQIMEAKDALAKMEMQGKRGTAEYNAVAQHLGMLNDQMGDTAMQARILADDHKGFRAVASAASGMAGAMSAAVGVASLLGAENEDLIKIQTRLQSVMAITIGLQQVAETLNKDSYFSVVLLTKAKTFLTAANYRLATSLGISTAAAKVLMATLTLGLSVAITAAIIAFDKYSSKQREASKAATEFKEAVSSSAKSSIAEYEKLRRTYQELGDDMKKKKKFIEDNKGAFDKLGVAVTGVNDADNLFIKNTELFKASIMERAKSTAAMEIAAEKYKDAMLKKMEADRREYEPNKIEKIEDFVNNRFSNKPKPIVVGDWEYYGNQAANKAAEKIRNDGRKIEVSADEFVKQAMESDKRIADIYKSLGIAENEKDKDKKTTTKPDKAIFDHRKAIAEKLSELRQQTARLEIEQMEDGLKKRLAQIGHEGAAEVAKVAEMQQKIVDEYNKANKDVKGFKAVGALADIDPEAARQFEDEVLKIKADTGKKREKATEEHQNAILTIARKYADERVRIEFDYNEDIKKLEADGQTEAANAARAKRDKAISDTTADMIRETEIYRLAMDDRLLISAEVTEKLIDDIRRRVEAEMAVGELTKEEGKKLLAEINKANVSRGFGKNPFKDLLTGLREYKKAKDDLNKNKDSATPAELAKMEDAANSMLKNTAEAAAASLHGVKDILGSVVDAMDEFGLLNEQQKKDAEDIIGMVGGAADIAAGIATGNPVQIIQGAISFVAKAASFFDFKSKRIRKEQNAVIDQVNELSRAYNRLQREVDKALGTDVFTKQRAQIENLKKQVSDYQRLIDLENKKRAKKRDQNAINEWKQAIDDAKSEMEDIVSDIREQLTGTTTKGMAGDLGNALVSALQEGEDAALKFGAVFDDVIRNAVLNAFKLKYLEKPIDEWLNDLGRYMDDGELQSWEKRALEGRRDAIFQQSKAGFDAISELFKVENKAQTQGIKGDVRNMSEDTGTAIVGAFNGMRLNVDAMLKRMQTFGELMDKFSRHLEKIEENTSFCRRLKDIDETLTDLKNNGMKLK